MKYDWLEEYCLAKPGVIKDWKEEWGAFRYLVGGKMFVMDGTDNENRKIITLKLEPMKGSFLREQYPTDIFPGYYMNKTHWNSVCRDGAVPDDLLREMLDESYALIFHALPKKIQREITANK